MSIATPRKLADELLFTSFYNGSLMLRLDAEKPAEKTIWRTEKASEKDTTHLNAVLSTPFLENGYIYAFAVMASYVASKPTRASAWWETFQATTSGEPVRWQTRSS